MPELPEVETTRKLLAPLLEGRTILGFEYDPSPRYSALEDTIGLTVSTLSRRGKYILIGFEDSDLELIVHLGMTGGFRPTPDKHTRVTVHTGLGHTDYSDVFFTDSRRFGKWRTVRRGEYAEMPTLHTMGPEPLSEDFVLEDFVEAASKAGTVKPWLLSQKPVAGLGNIYADESLHLSGIHPESRKLSRAQSVRLFGAIKQVLAKAVHAGGSTLNDGSYQQPDGNPGYFQLEHRAYGREDQPCLTCGEPIYKYWLGGRGTHICAKCQPLER